MNLAIRRGPTVSGATIGELFLDGSETRYVWTLEDPVREIPGEEVSTWKVPGDTAIPRGRYQVAITKSPRFGRRMPLLLGVPGFESIRLHTGNTAADTEGCILVGLTRQGVGIYQSRAAFEPLYAKIEEALLAAEEVWLSVG